VIVPRTIVTHQCDETTWVVVQAAHGINMTTSAPLPVPNSVVIKIDGGGGTRCTATTSGSPTTAGMIVRGPYTPNDPVHRGGYGVVGSFGSGQAARKAAKVPAFSVKRSMACLLVLTMVVA
jgi:hypothetical protein